MIRGWLFDLDGTIGDTLPLCVAAFREAIEPRVEQPLSDAAIIAAFGPSEEGTIARLCPHDEHAAVEAYLEVYQRLHGAFTPTPFAGIAEILRDIHRGGFPLGLVTGKGGRSTVITLREYGIESLFSPIETGARSGPVKPERLREVVTEWALPSSDLLYVGDSPSDVVACREVGIPVAAAAWAKTSDREALASTNPDYCFATVGAFAAFVKKALSDYGD